MTAPSTDPAAKQPFSRSQKSIAALLVAMLFLNYVDRLVLSVLAPVMRNEIGLTQTSYAWAVNAFLFSYALMYFGSGLVIDRLGSRIGMALSVGLWSLFAALHSAVRGVYDLVVLRFLLGIAEPGGWTGAVRTVGERFAPRQRALATGIFCTGASVAMMVSPPLVVYLRQTLGWRAAFLIPGFAGLLCLPLWFKATAGAPAAAATQEAGTRLSPRELGALLCNRRVLAYVLTRFFGDFTGYFPLFWMPDYLMTHRGFSFVAMGALGWIPFFWNDLGPITGSFASNALIRRGYRAVFSRKVVMTCAAATVAAGAAFSSASGTVAILASLSVSTFAVGVWAVNLHTLPNDAFPTKVVASIYGLAGSAGAIGGIFFNTLVGYWSTQGAYWAVFALWSILQPLGLIGLWLWLGDAEQKPQEGE